ncbi:hypothetical protein CSB11_01495 [Candidatus Campbellbacteria bacterium]|nr:MAG: hypothetical protein CSB11_01495 [Candidatus Campbellbacteria bacterium]
MTENKNTDDQKDYDKLYPKTPTVLDENEILDFWNQNKIFEKSIEQNKEKEQFVFYDGPPFATGTPHYGHIVPGTIKDVFPRYKSMKGYYVKRQWGWDCHGMPIENIVEKKHNLNSKKDIEEFGIENFTKSAAESIFTYKDVWEETIPKTGRWADMTKPYLTMSPDYIESVWWAFKELYDKGLVTKDFKAMHICPRCETTLSNRDVSEGYKDIKDLSLIAKFKLEDQKNTFVLAWTTTPWTLPGNVALAVGSDIDYVKVKDAETEEFFIFAKNKKEELEQKSQKTFEVIEELKGSDLIGQKYVPLFDYYAKNKDLKNQENGWLIYDADFVTTEDGTGIVHIAPAFGEDDMELGRQQSLPFVQHVGMNGKFNKEVTDFAGLKVRKTDFHEEADIEIIKFLAGKGALFHKEKYEHSYPHCWRCKTPLLNYAASSWFVDVPQVREQLAEENKKVGWVPEYVGQKRFQNWLETARPWAVSRSRYWGSPIPIWQNTEDQNDFKVIGSLEELKNYTRGTNNFFAIRHGQSKANVNDNLSSEIGKHGDELTEEGKKQVLERAKELKETDFIQKNSQVQNSDKIDIIISSPFVRTKQSAEIIAEELGISKDYIVYDERIQERDFGSATGKPNPLFDKWIENEAKTENHKFEGGESHADIVKRTMEFLFEINQKYEGKNILLVTHFTPTYVMVATSLGYNMERARKMLTQEWKTVQNSQVYPINFAPYPHDQNFKLDYHRPYIDDVKFVHDGKNYEVITDVFDTWFDSGSMPYASRHYPFENTDLFNPEKDLSYPADFISEGLDQTRGWFYVLMVLGYILFGKSPYKNVVVHGMLMAEDGKKMSKSLQNYPPMEKVLNIYGADALRLFLLTSSIVKGDSPGFSEKGVDEILKKVIMKSKNILSFYNLYKNEVSNKELDYKKSPNVLDKWIVKKTENLVQKVTDGLESYKLDEASREFVSFIDDFSTWYIRRSRDRYKGQNQEDKDFAILTTKEVLKTFAKTISPFAPFLSEVLWKDLKSNDDKISVCLESWPEIKKNLKDKIVSNKHILEQMQMVRDIVSFGLEARSEAGIKVRQPLQKALAVGDFSEISKNEQFVEIIKDELNVKELVFAENLDEVQEKYKEFENKALENKESDNEIFVFLDTVLNDELKEEGNFREFLRLVQTLRKKEGLQVKDEIELKIDVDQNSKDFIEKNKEELKNTAGVKNINYSEIPTGESVKINDIELKVILIK